MKKYKVIVKKIIMFPLEVKAQNKYEEQLIVEEFIYMINNPLILVRLENNHVKIITSYVNKNNHGRRN